jgi:hypothetical protein
MLALSFSQNGAIFGKNLAAKCASMKQALLVLGISLAGCLFAASVYGTTYTYVYTGGPSEKWSSSSSWNPSGVPPAGSTVIITAGGTLIVDVHASVSGMTLANTLLLMNPGASLDLSGPATVGARGEIDLASGIISGDTNGEAVIAVSQGGGFICSGGSLEGIITLAINSILDLSGPPDPFNGPTTFTNYGTVNWGNVSITNTGGTNTYIYNYGLWDSQTNNTLYGSGPSGGVTIFNNYGTFRKDGGTLSGIGGSDDYTELDPNTTFNNFGTVDVETGLLEFFTGTSYGGSVFDTASNSYTGFGNDYIMTGDVTFAGAGFISGALNGSYAVLHGALSLSFMTFSNTLTLASNSVLIASPIYQGSLFPLPAQSLQTMARSSGPMWTSTATPARRFITTGYGMQPRIIRFMARLIGTRPFQPLGPQPSTTTAPFGYPMAVIL